MSHANTATSVSSSLQSESTGHHADSAVPSEEPSSTELGHTNDFDRGIASGALGLGKFNRSSELYHQK